MDGTWVDVPVLAEKIARYIVEVDESAVLGYPTNWVVAGANPASGETFENQVDGLSAGSKWRSGRPDPLAIPGVEVVEACSPKYASMATKLGNEYITALPCEVTVFVDEKDPTLLAISFLDPNFMFSVMFEGAITNAVTSGVLTAERGSSIQYTPKYSLC